MLDLESVDFSRDLSLAVLTVDSDTRSWPAPIRIELCEHFESHAVPEFVMFVLPVGGFVSIFHLIPRFVCFD